MYIALENRLLVARNSQQCFKDARGVGMKAEDLAHSGSVLEVNPAALLDTRDQTPRKSPHHVRFVLKAVRQTLLAFYGFFEFLPPAYPYRRVPYDALCSLNGSYARHHEGLTFELTGVQAGQEIPVQFRIEIAEGTKQRTRSSIEEFRSWFLHWRIIAEALVTLNRQNIVWQSTVNFCLRLSVQ